MTDKFLDKTGTEYLIKSIYDEIIGLKSSMLNADTITRLITLADTAATKSDLNTMVKNVNLSGRSLTITFGDGSTKSFTTVDNNTTYTEVTTTKNGLATPKMLNAVNSITDTVNNTIASKVINGIHIEAFFTKAQLMYQKTSYTYKTNFNSTPAVFLNCVCAGTNSTANGGEVVNASTTSFPYISTCYASSNGVNLTFTSPQNSSNLYMLVSVICVEIL